MKILQINIMYPNGSTGRICESIYKKCIEKGYECKIATAYGHKNDGVINISSWLDNHIHNRILREKNNVMQAGKIIAMLRELV